MNDNIKQIAEKVYYMTPGDNDRPALGYIICGASSIMIDSGNSPAHAKLFISELQKRELKYPDHLVLTHWHWDHIFGSASINATVVAHNITAEKIKGLKKLTWTDEEFAKRIDSRQEIKFCRDNMKNELGNISSNMIKSPNITFDKHTLLGKGDDRVEIIHVGGDHSKDSVVIYSPSENVIFLGDCIYTSVYTKTPCYTKSKFIPILNKLLSLDADMYIDSHSEDIISRDDIKSLLDLVSKTAAKTAENEDILKRSDFPNTHDNKLCKHILEAWDMFINYQ